MTSQEKPRGVCIGVPFAHRYPEAPPPPTSAWSGGGATHLASESSVDQKSWCRRHLGTIICGTLTVLAWVGMFKFIFMDSKYPSFKVESVSISVDNKFKSDDSQVTAEWNIGFSVENSNWLSSFDYQDFHVWVQCMSQGWSGTIFRPFYQEAGNTTFLNATINTLLPHYSLPGLIQGVTPEFDLMFGANYDEHTVKAVCKNMTVGFSWNATKGIMVGGPRLCPVDFHTYNYQ